MTHKAKSVKKQNNREQPAPLGISKQDWAKTPISVRNFVISILDSNQKRKRGSEDYVPMWPTWFMLFMNLIIIFGLTVFLTNKFVIRCVTPHYTSAASAAVILPVIFHIIWRNIYVLIPSNLDESITLGRVTLPFTILVSLLNEIHPWKLPSRLLGFLFLILLTVGVFLNLSTYSPVRPPEELSAIQGFSIQRFDGSLAEGLPVGGTLTIKVNERAVVEAVFRGETQRPCLWNSKLSSPTEQTGCSILLDEVSRTGRDTLTVTTKSACGTEDHVALHIVVLP
jgi:hypothetical protein